MFHGPAAKVGKDPASDYKTRLGVWMCLAYSIVYALFVFISVTNISLMEMEVFSGVNLAVFYGFGLIIVALIQALIYNHKCTAKERELSLLDGEKENG
jgi:uncharacterized membrane protein (DUF485 family)